MKAISRCRFLQQMEHPYVSGADMVVVPANLGEIL